MDRVEYKDSTLLTMSMTVLVCYGRGDDLCIVYVCGCVGMGVCVCARV